MYGFAPPSIWNELSIHIMVPIVKASANKNAILVFAFKHPISPISDELMWSNFFLESITPKTSEMKKSDPRKKLTAKVHPKYVKCWGI